MKALAHVLLEMLLVFYLFSYCLNSLVFVFLTCVIKNKKFQIVILDKYTGDFSFCTYYYVII